MIIIMIMMMMMMMMIRMMIMIMTMIPVAASNSLTISMWLLSTAIINAVTPSTVSLLTSIARFSSSLTQSTSPSYDANSSMWLIRLTSTSTLGTASRRRKALVWPQSAATDRAVFFLLPDDDDDNDDDNDDDDNDGVSNRADVSMNEYRYV